jgi:hypothetical protein
MFVRNNTKCPNCGKIAATDIYLAIAQPTPMDSLVIIVECYECLAFHEVVVDLPVLRLWLGLLAATVRNPSDESLLRPLRWSKSVARILSWQQAKAVRRSAEEWFRCGLVCLETVELPSLLGIRHKLVTSGGRVQGKSFRSLVSAWCGL